jgi:putative salt-induced outer membrane protein
MMKKNLFVIILVSIFSSTGFALAEDGKIWKDQAELSYIQTGGNTEVTNLSAKNLLTYQATEKIKFDWSALALFAETEVDGSKEKSAERYATELRMEYSLTERFYTLAYGGWLRDEFAGIDDRYYIGPAVGYKFLIGPKHFLSAEAGVDYVKEDYVDNTDDDYMRGRAFGQYAFALTEKTRFSQSLEYLHAFDNSDNYNINSETALITALSDKLSLKTSYVVNYDNEPVPEELDETDTTLAVTIIVNF